MMFALLGAMVLVPLNMVCAMLTQLAAWRKGHFRLGFLHGMLLGPFGLLTVRLHRRLHQPTRILLAQIGACGSGGVFQFYGATALLLLGMLIVNALIIYLLAVRQAPASLGIWLTVAIGLLLIGLIFYATSCPMLNRMPPLDDYDDYPDEPEIAADIREVYEAHHFVADLETYRLAALICGLYFVFSGFAGLICLIANGDVDLKPYSPWPLALAGVTLAGMIYFIARYLSTKYRYAQPQPENDVTSALWHPAIPISLRAYLAELWHDAEARERQFKRSLYVLVLSRYFLPTAGVAAAVDLLGAAQKYPAALSWCLVAAGVLGLGWSISLGRRSGRQISAIRELALRMVDASHVTNAYIAAAEAERHGTDSGETGPAEYLRQLHDKCPELVIPADDAGLPDSLHIPRFYRQPGLGAWQLLLMHARQALWGVGLAVILLAYTAAYFREGSPESSDYVLGVATLLLFSVFLRWLSRFGQAAIRLAPEWRQRGLDQAGLPELYKSMAEAMGQR